MMRVTYSRDYNVLYIQALIGQQNSFYEYFAWWGR